MNKNSFFSYSSSSVLHNNNGKIKGNTKQQLNNNGVKKSYYEEYEILNGKKNIIKKTGLPLNDNYKKYKLVNK
ncbi:hypothetical protein Hokovirus_3_244 [Hokovirus HKV1]|uniref:Uncharacterized protein n=1 Tax=Hokovirus HKV1 TaxID=1977638 RepID=A0A1V0SH24_9VIRU|nr:hypothetical protein Hokovirus_3_244 [Hokovirus HKV1]